MIAALNDVAHGLPDGLETPVTVSICNGPGEALMLTTEFEVQPRRTVDRATMKVRTTSAVVSAHPHRDPMARSMNPVDLDAELAALTASAPTSGATRDSASAAEIVIPPDATSIVIDTGHGPGIVMPLGEDRRPITPGSPEAVERGCTCDAEKNNDGRGVDTDADSVYFIYRKDCPVHRQIDPPGAISVIG